MSRSIKSLLFSTLLLTLVFLFTQDAAAMAIRSRPLVGTVQAFDEQTRELVFMEEGVSRASDFVVTRRTQYLLDWSSVHASDLKPGTKATVYYRKPLFGKPFITKVTWQKAK